jgi:hypothetical protein
MNRDSTSAARIRGDVGVDWVLGGKGSGLLAASINDVLDGSAEQNEFDIMVWKQ